MNKLIIHLAYIMIIITMLFLCGISYAYFSIPVEGDSNDINISTLSDDIKITYVETSNLSMVNGYTGDNITKTFYVENTGSVDIYYDIILENVVNNFSNVEDLHYKLNSSNGVFIKEKVLPINDSTIASNILIKQGEKHEYTLYVEFLKTEEDQSENMNKTFSSNIKIIQSKNVLLGKNLFENGSIGKMIEDNAIGSEEQINLLTDKTNGIYYTNSTIDGGIVYFYRGNNTLNNNAVLDNKCYKIIRTTIDGGVRLIYSGEYIDNICSNDSLDAVSFNTNNNYNAYVGYMYGNASSSNYNDEHSNIGSSEIKIYLDSWYNTNISKFDDLILKSSIYCNNRKTNKFTYKGTLYNTLGYSNNNTGYLLMNNLKNNNVSYDCENENDRFSVENGNKKLTTSIGLITANELYYSGYLSDKNNFLNIKYSFWTMTPAYYNGNIAYNFIAKGGSIIECDVSKDNYVRPVITIKGNTKLSSGDGSIKNPYIIY